MSASITLMGVFDSLYLKNFFAWVNKQGLEGVSKSLTPLGDMISVVRIDLLQAVAKSKEQDFRNALLLLSDDSHIDHIYQTATPDINEPGIAVFDMDSTLIKAEVMDELAVEMGIGEQIAHVTASAMRGEIDFVESFVKRLALLKGLSSDVMERVYQRIVHMDGIVPLMKVLHHFGWHTAILSGGFTYFADRLKVEYSINEVHANVLEIESGLLTGKHLGPIVDAQRKAYLLSNMVDSSNINWSQTLACGDGANDLLMLNRAALGVALHAKPLVRKQAPCPMNVFGLEGILFLLGLTCEQIQSIMK